MKARRDLSIAVDSGDAALVGDELLVILDYHGAAEYPVAMTADAAEILAMVLLKHASAARRRGRKIAAERSIVVARPPFDAMEDADGSRRLDS